jgi:peptidoglycan/xylan/chitin deacetylase (PgdA/CDA1 family)
MSMSISGQFRRAARAVAKVFEPRAIVLLYHRVNEVSSDPQLLCVSRKHFDEHLQVLHDFTRPGLLRMLQGTLEHTFVKYPAVILTFDDGYADNLHYAKPLLERHDMPATVFVTTDLLGSKAGFWKDVLNRILLLPGNLPGTLKLNINGASVQWELGEAARYSVEDFERHHRWDVTQPSNPTTRQQLYRSLSYLLQTASGSEQRNAVDEIVSWAGMPPNSSSDDSILSAEEVVQLACGGLVEVGSHTASHPVLSCLALNEQREEIQQSKRRLEDILGYPVTSFAYPYGGPSHYTPETVAATREAGFKVACSNFEGMVRRNSDMYQLPRFLVRDWNGEEFARRLRSWLSY